MTQTNSNSEHDNIDLIKKICKYNLYKRKNIKKIKFNLNTKQKKKPNEGKKVILPFLQRNKHPSLIPRW